MKKKRWTFVLLSLGLVMAGACGDDRSQRGSPAVYERINATTDCTELQETFDRAAAGNKRYSPGSPGHGWTTDYMAAADKRMRQVGCYDR